MAPFVRFLFLMAIIVAWISVKAEVPIASNQPHLRFSRYTSAGDWGAAISPWNSVASNHRSYPYPNGRGGWSNFWSGFGGR